MGKEEREREYVLNSLEKKEDLFYFILVAPGCL